MMEHGDNYTEETKEALTLQLQQVQSEIRNLKILGMVIVILSMTIGGYVLIRASQTGRMSAAAAAPIMAGLFLVRLVTTPLNKKKELAWELDNKLTQMQ